MKIFHELKRSASVKCFIHKDQTYNTKHTEAWARLLLAGFKQDFHSYLEKLTISWAKIITTSCRQIVTTFHCADKQ